MENLPEFNDVHSSSTEEVISLKLLDDSVKEWRKDDKSLLRKRLQEGLAQRHAENISQKNVLSISAAETDNSEHLSSMDFSPNSLLKTVDVSAENVQSVMAADCVGDARHSDTILPVTVSSDAAHIVNGENSHDFSATCDDSFPTDLPPTLEDTNILKMTFDNSSKDNGNLDTMNDADVSEWLQGAIRHLHSNAALNDNLTLDDNDLDIDNVMVEEDTVEVQEFLQEEEIAEETIADDAEDGSSKEDEKPLSYDLQQGYKILREIMGNSNKSITWAFINAVDRNAEGCHNYYEKIRNPMWLMRMKEKFERREYENITEYVADMRQMLENCYRFNGLNHPISRNGEKLEQMMEQKLLLLSRDLREKTSIVATSGKVVDIPITGTRRSKFSGATGTTTLLHRLRWEALEKEKEAKRLQLLEKKMAYEEFLKGLQDWEDRLFAEPFRQQMKAMWELPQIGQFLFLCEKALNLGEVSQYELECCLLLPRESSALQRIMTSLLSTPHQRSKIQGKTIMPYRVWDDRLRQLLRQWYKTYEDNYNSTKLTAIKLGLEEKFFKVVGHKNPLEKKKFHELTFYQRVWIVKSLCDHCLETQKSICETMETQPLLDLKESILGKDNDGNTYIHFPQFCGEDLRIYRQSPQKIVIEGFSKESVSCAKVKLKRRHKHRGRSNIGKFSLELPEPPTSSSTPRARDSRLRQNPKQVQNYKVSESSSSSDAENSSADEDGAEDDEEMEENMEEENEEAEDESNELEENKETEGSQKEKDDNNDKISVNEEMELGTKSISENEKSQSPKKLRGRRKRHPSDSGKKEEDFPAVVSTPDSWTTVDSSSAVIPRRSLRKIIEESKKDAVSSPTAGGSNRTPLRRSSISSSSSAALSRSGMDSVSSHVQSSGKKDSKSYGVRKRKRGSTSEADDDYDDDDDVDDDAINDCNTEASSSLSVSPPRIMTRSNLQHRKTVNQAEKNQKNSRSSDKSSSKKIDPEPLELGRITRNLYKILVEAKIDVCDGNNRQTGDARVAKESKESGSKKTRHSSKQNKCSVKDSADTGEAPGDAGETPGDDVSDKLGKRDNRRKKRSCLTSVSKSSREPDVDGANMEGDVVCALKSNVESVAGKVDLECSRDAGFLEGDTGQGDSKVKSTPGTKKTDELDSTSAAAAAEDEKDKKEDPEVKKKVEEFDVKPVLSETVAECTPGTGMLSEDLELTTRLSSSDDTDKNCSLEKISTMSEINSSVKQLKEEEGAEEKESLQSMNVDAVESKESDLGTFGLPSGADVKVETTVKEEVERDEICEILGPDIGPFELIVNSIEGLRMLVDKFADKDEKDDKDSDGSLQENKQETEDKGVYRKRCTAELHKRLSFLLQEVGVYEPRLIKLNKRKMIRLRKEQENYKEEEPEKEQVEDIWENNDSTSWASNGNTEAPNDESSIDAESNCSIKAEDKSDESRKKPRPPRGKRPISEALLSTLPSALASEVVSQISASSNGCGAINTRKRAAAARNKGKVQSVKKARLRSGCVGNDAKNVSVLTSRGDVGTRADLETSPPSLNAGDSLLRGLVSDDAAAKKKQNSGMPSAVSTEAGNQFNLPFGKPLSFQLTPRCSATSTGFMARLIFSPPSTGSNLLSAAKKAVPNSSGQHSSLRIALGQSLQPMVQPNVRLATSSGSNIQFLSVSNMNQLSPSILQQLLNSQNLVMVAPSAGVQNASASCISTVAPSNLVHNCLMVPNNSPQATVTTSNNPNFRPVNAGQVRPSSIQNLPFAVVTKPSLVGHAGLGSFQHSARTTFSSVSGYVLASPLNSAGMTAATIPGTMNSGLVGSLQAPHSALSSSTQRPVLIQNFPNSSPAGDSVANQKFTSNLTVRALLGNRNIADQVRNLLSGSLPTKPDVAVSLSESANRLAFGSTNFSSSVSASPLIGGHLIDNRLIGRITGSVTNTSASAESLVGLIAKCTSSGNVVSLPFQNSICPPRQFVNMNSQRLGLKDDHLPVNVDPAMQLSVIVPNSLELGHSSPVIQRASQNSTPGLKLVTPSGIGSLQMPQMAVAALVSIAEQTKQIVLVTPEQAAALARKNLVDQAVKAAITGPINTSLPTANLEIPSSSLGMPMQPRNVNTHTTTVMKSPIPSLPRLFNNSLSPGKTIGQSSVLSSTPASISRFISVVSLSSSCASTTAQSAMSAVPLRLSVSVPDGVVSAASQAALPILLNSALVMPGNQNVLLLQQASMQLLSLDSNRSVLGQAPLKIAVSLPQSAAASSVCSLVSSAHYSQRGVMPTASVHVPFNPSNLLIPNRGIVPSTLPFTTFVNVSVSAPMFVQSTLTHATTQTVASHASSLMRQLSTDKILSTNIAVSNLSSVHPFLQPLLSPNQARSHLVAQATAADNMQTLVAPSRPAFKIVIPPKYDGIPLGQLPIQGGMRLFNKLPSAIVALGQQSQQNASLQIGSNVNTVTDVRQLDGGNASQLQGMRLVAPSMTSSVLLQEKLQSVSQVVSSMRPIPAPTVVTPSERPVILVSTTGSFTGVSNAVVAAIPQQTGQGTPPFITQRRPVLQIQANALNIGNMKGQVTQMTVQPNSSTFQPVRGQLVHLAVQPVGGGRGNKSSGFITLPNCTDMQKLPQPVLRMVDSKQYSARTQSDGLTSVHPLSQPSEGIAGVPSLLSSNIPQVQSVTMESGLNFSNLNSFAEVLHTFATGQATERSPATALQRFPSTTRMNLEVAANWLLQAASVVDSSSDKEHDSRKNSTSESSLIYD